MKALLLLLAAMLLGFSPVAGLAHEGAVHAEGEKAAAARSVDHSWSPICPPGSGHVCGCGNLSLSDAGAKPPALLPRRVASIHPTGMAAPAPLPEAKARPALQFSPALPRAPPVSS